jgi:hypothetical protein
VAVSWGVFAAPLCPGGVNGGSAATLNTYLGTGSNATCMIDDKIFSNFSYVQDAGPAAGTITLTPTMVGNSEGFVINGGWLATPGQDVDSLLGYRVMTAAGAATINDADLALLVSSPDGGIVNITETVCVSALINPISGCPAANLHTLVVNNPPTPFDVGHINFAPDNLVDISKDIHLHNPMGSLGNVTLSSFSNSVSQTVPEPASLAILGASLLGMGAAAAGRRRFRK